MSVRKSRSPRGTPPPPFNLANLGRELRDVLVDAAIDERLGRAIVALLDPSDFEGLEAWKRADLVIVERAIAVLLEDRHLAKLVKPRTHRLHLENCACCRRKDAWREIRAHRAKHGLRDIDASVVLHAEAAS